MNEWNWILKQIKTLNQYIIGHNVLGFASNVLSLGLYLNHNIFF